jgi:DNA mismatch repair protein MSH6
MRVTLNSIVSSEISRTFAKATNINISISNLPHPLICRSNKIVFKDLGKEIFQIECPVGIPVPSNWRLLSSTKAVKRYWSPEVEKKVRELLECRETHKNVVNEMQGRLYGRFDADYDKWMTIVRSVAHLDCLVGLSVFNETGLGEPKCRPEFVESEGIRSFVEFEELRHPCIVEGYVFFSII